ncbi:MAG: exonuclease SbcCD subunit D C-terminal domain-containing protein [Desulfobacterales bacterium]|nr:exonuclease SbcCD subunit D C-terminal domain-containing protein [Desulfobacterales bacterium]
MKLLHTSDWHIGRLLYGRKRYREFEDFLEWLAAHVRDHHIDILLISGDIFDTTTPSNRAQALYYRFLRRVGATGCSHVVVVGGNHDSPSFLDAPAQLLKALDVHVIGSAPSDMDDEILDLADAHGTPLARICAVPYLRDRDIRTASVGEDAGEKTLKLVKGITAHYREIAEKASADHNPELPLVATGHLFAAGGKVTEGDGVRELYIGSLARVGTDAFAEDFDYVALGHLHVAQTVGGQDRIRYSGSPIPMGFGEAGQTKKMIQVEFQGRTPEITEVEIPCFQPLEPVRGDLDTILNRLQALKDEDSTAWLEIEYTGEGQAPDLRERVETAVEDSSMEIRRIRNRRQFKAVTQTPVDSLDSLDETQVFQRLLDGAGIPHGEQDPLRHTYGEILKEMQEKDTQAQ